MQKIGPCLWFDHQAEEAAEFYVSVFPASRILGKTRFPEGLPGEPGSVMTVSFVLDGAEFLGLNGGPLYRFNPAVSFVVRCNSQAEIDHFWSRLAEGGAESQCGWLTDRYGVSWQIVPNMLIELLEGGDGAALARATAAMLKMKKFDIAALQCARDQP